MGEVLASNWELIADDMKGTHVVIFDWTLWGLVWKLRIVLFLSYITIAALSHMKRLRYLDSSWLIRLVLQMLDCLNSQTLKPLILLIRGANKRILLFQLEIFFRISLIDKIFKSVVTALLFDITRGIDHLQLGRCPFMILLCHHKFKTARCLVADSRHLIPKVRVDTPMCRAASSFLQVLALVEQPNMLRRCSACILWYRIFFWGLWLFGIPIGL